MKRKVTIGHQLVLEMVTLPNYLPVAGSCPRGAERPVVSVADLSTKAVEAYIRAWGEAFREHVAKKRKAREMVGSGT